MREPLRDRGRLEHILDAIDRVEEFTSGRTKEQLVSDPLHLHATVYNVREDARDAIWLRQPSFPLAPLNQIASSAGSPTACAFIVPMFFFH